MKPRDRNIKNYQLKQCNDGNLIVDRSLSGIIKLQPAIFPLSQHVIRFHELPADTTQRFLQ